MIKIFIEVANFDTKKRLMSEQIITDKELASSLSVKKLIQNKLKYTSKQTLKSLEDMKENELKENLL